MSELYRFEDGKIEINRRVDHGTICWSEKVGCIWTDKERQKLKELQKKNPTDIIEHPIIEMLGRAFSSLRADVWISHGRLMNIRGDSLKEWAYKCVEPELNTKEVSAEEIFYHMMQDHAILIKTTFVRDVFEEAREVRWSGKNEVVPVQMCGSGVQPVNFDGRVFWFVKSPWGWTDVSNVTIDELHDYVDVDNEGWEICNELCSSNRRFFTN